MAKDHWFTLLATTIVLLHAPYSTMAAFALWRGPSTPTTTRSSSPSSPLGTTSSSTTVTETTTSTSSSSSMPAAAAAAATLNGEKDIVKTVDVLSLDSIRDTLTRQEETIIFALIERSQYHSNSIVYEKGGFGSLGTPIGSSPPPPPAAGEEFYDDNEELSFMEYMLVGTEAMHCACRRYISPEEHAFFPERLPAEGPMGALPQIHYPQDLLSAENGASFINFNKILLQKYVDSIVPRISKCAGDDEQYGSTVLADVAVLQALSRRVHYGKFVAESKYRSDPEAYQKLVDYNDANGVMELLTNQQVEAKVLRRARIKAATYGTEPILLPSMVPDGSTASSSSTIAAHEDGGEKVMSISDTTSMVAAAAASAVVAVLEALGEKPRRGKVDPYEIEKVYRDIIIPLTKVIEVAYLFLRCGRNPPPEYEPPIWPPVPPPMPSSSLSSSSSTS